MAYKPKYAKSGKGRQAPKVIREDIHDQYRPKSLLPCPKQGIWLLWIISMPLWQRNWTVSAAFC